MVEISCKSEYALLAMLELAVRYQQGEPLQIRQIASMQNIPDRYLEQVLAALRRGGLIRSQRGAKGGYFLAREPWQITLLEVIGCIEGWDLEGKNGQENPHTIETALVRDVWQEARQAFQSVLQNQTLQDLCDRRNTRLRSDFMYYI
ncbi:MAG: Rrf2 family transcriptional regulator [Oscillatoria sp. SIO1A7]|nr:Rrf2 family transcriptional regulator [Oscillatoria sp. SIO1A7]